MSLQFSVICISDTRSLDNSPSTDWLAQAIITAGHQVHSQHLSRDDRHQIRAVISQLLVEPQVDVVLCTGGTGFSPRDVTPEAVEPLLDRQIPGFGEVFRAISLKEIGLATIHSRALAGMANGRLVVCVPGSPNACKTAWNSLLREQLNAQTRPCNFAEVLSQHRGGGSR